MFNRNDRQSLLSEAVQMSQSETLESKADLDRIRQDVEGRRKRIFLLCIILATTAAVFVCAMAVFLSRA